MKRSRPLGRLLAIASLAMLTVGPLPLTAAQEATPSIVATPVTLLPSDAVATGLANPRGVAVAEDGSVYVAEAGLGGEEPFESPTFGPSTRGTTGRVSRTAPDGATSIVASGLPSFALGGFEVLGPAGIVATDSALYLTNSHFVPGVEPRPNDAAVLRIDPASGEVSTIADLGAFERENNPDGFILESDPYGIAWGADDQLYVADAGANALYRVDPASGDLALVTVFPGLPGEGENPARNGAAELDPVPTGVAAAPDGGVYVGFLGGFPFPPGSAKVVRVAPDGSQSDAVTGLTAVVDVEVGPDGMLYVTEFATGFDAEGQTGWRADSGRVLRIPEGGSPEVVVAGLNKPNGIAFDDAGDLYVTVDSDVPPQAGPQGQLLRFDAVAPPSQGGTPKAGSAAFAPVPETAKGVANPVWWRTTASRDVVT